jgi:catechol 2,3-dioxygenase
MCISNNKPFTINPYLKIDHVHIRVSNLKEALAFYQGILGFRVLKEEGNTKTAFLGSAVNNINNITEGQSIKRISPPPLLILTETNDNDREFKHKTIKKEAGLFHFAILIPKRKNLAAFLRHIQENLDPAFYEGMADHAVSESIYIHDLDHNGIEIYCDRSPSEWKWTDNKVYMVTDPLNVKDLFNQNPDEKWTGLPSATTIGHVHLHVSNLNRSRKFYGETFGLYHTASYPGAYFFAADHYHHHVATNIWLGTNIAPATDNTSKPGLTHYAVRLPYDKKEAEALKRRFADLEISIIDEITIESDIHHHQQQPSSFYIHDPDGIKIQFLFI